MSTLKSLVNETTNIKNEIIECRDNLKQILIDKKIEGLESENKLSNLVYKVNEFNDYSKTLYLYRDGNECTDITGGWVEGYKTSSAYTIEKNNSRIKVSITSGKIQIRTSKSIDLSNYNSLYIDAYPVTNTVYNFYVYGVVGNAGDSLETNALAVYNAGSAKGTRKSFKVDISSINKSAYIGIYTQCNSGKTEHAIYNVWLEE